MKKKKKQKTKYKFYLNKYNFSDNFSVIISFNLWEEILLLNSNIKRRQQFRTKKSKYYFDESTSSWQKLMYFNNIEDSEFEGLLKDVYNRFSQKEYKDYNQFKYISSMLLDFQEEDLFNIKEDELFELVKTNFTLLFEGKIFNFEDIYFMEKGFDALDAKFKISRERIFQKITKIY